MVKLKSVAKYPICHKGTLFMPNVITETSRETASFLLKSYRKEKFFILVEGDISKPVGNFPVVNISPIVSKPIEVKGFNHDFKTFEEKKVEEVVEPAKGEVKTEETTEEVVEVKTETKSKRTRKKKE